MQDYILFFFDEESSKVLLSDVEAHKAFPNAAFFFLLVATSVM
jgi:hypothetical protein